jgi:hypothetical protein
MAVQIATVKIASDETAHGYIIINASDFDPAVHTEFQPSASTGGDSGESGSGSETGGGSEESGGNGAATDGDNGVVPVDNVPALNLAALGAKAAADAVSEVVDVSALQAAFETETRSTVKAAIEKQIAKLEGR